MSTINGAVTLRSSSHVQAASGLLRASVVFLTGARIALVVQMNVAGAVRLTSGSHVDTAEAIAQTLTPVWFTDEPRTEFTVHTPWTSNQSDSST